MPTFWQRNGVLLRVSPTCITNLNPTYTPQAHFVLSFLQRFRDATDYHTLVYYHVIQRSVWSNAYALLHFYITCVSRFQWSLAYACFTLSSRFINVCLQVMTLTKFIVIMSTSTCLDPGFIMLIIGVTTPLYTDRLYTLCRSRSHIWHLNTTFDSIYATLQSCLPVSYCITLWRQSMTLIERHTSAILVHTCITICIIYTCMSTRVDTSLFKVVTIKNY